MPGPKLETLVDDLIVVAVVPDAPEIGPGDAIVSEVFLGQPNDTPVDLLVWTCLPLDEETCLEQVLEERFTVLEGVSGSVAVEREIPTQIGGILSAIGEELPIFVWSLACEAGLCPLIEQAKTGEVADADLINPIEGLKTLPFDGVSLAYRGVWVSERPVEERRKNPEVDLQSALPQEVALEERVSLQFDVVSHGEQVDAYGYSLSGGFEEISFRVFEDQVTVDWFAPEELDGQTETQLWVVFQSESGGTAVWTDQLVLNGEMQ